MKTIESADPAADFKAALKKQDHRFVGVYGYALSLPGVPEEQQASYVEKYGVKIIEGTSDYWQGTDGARLQKAAINYATRYNQLLLKGLCGNNKECALSKHSLVVGHG